MSRRIGAATMGFLQGRRLMPLLSTLMVIGCTTGPQPLAESTVRDAKARTLLLVLPRDPGFIVGSSNAVGLVGAGVHWLATSELRKKIEQARLVDPSLAIADRLARALASKFSLQMSVVTEPTQRVHNPRAPGPLPAPPKLPPSDLVLTVKTTKWGLLYAPMQGDRYYVAYHVETQLSEGRTSHVLARDACVGDEPRIVEAQRTWIDDKVKALTDDAPTAEQMLAQDGARLRSDLAIASERCEVRFRSVYFSGSPPPR